MKPQVTSKGYLRVGRCKRCGRCCRGHWAVRGHNPKVLRDTGLMLGIQPDLIDELIDELSSEKFNCEHLRWGRKGGRRIAVCSIYDGRPQACRDYPAEPADLLPGCGYSFIGKANLGHCKGDKG